MNDFEYLEMINNNIKVFEDTRELSKTVYRAETLGMKRDTKIYDRDISVKSKSLLDLSDITITFLDGGTVNTAYKYAKEGMRVAMLNFADAKRPGGWVKDGAPTQEENICRCTNLYEVLIMGKCDTKYYKVNDIYNLPNRHLNEAYSDNLIYSPNVLIFKEDTTYKRLPVQFVDVITCPSPCGDVKGVEKILEYRTEKIIKSAIINDADVIILGAWGCGAFGQDAAKVAKAFVKALKKYPMNAVFAIRSTPGIEDDKQAGSEFQKEFQKEWVK